MYSSLAIGILARDISAGLSECIHVCCLFFVIIICINVIFTLLVDKKVLINLCTYL